MKATVKAGPQNQRVHILIEISNLFQIKISRAVIPTKYDKVIFKSYYKKFSSRFWMRFGLAYELKNVY